MLKAIGATRRHVLGIYLFMVFILGAVASVVAIPLAVISGYGFAGFVAKILNFNILTKVASDRAVCRFDRMRATAADPVCAAGAVKRHRISVQSALSDYGISVRTLRIQYQTSAGGGLCRMASGSPSQCATT